MALEIRIILKKSRNINQIKSIWSYSHQEMHFNDSLEILQYFIKSSQHFVFL